MFRRILGVTKDVGLIEKTLSDTETEFSFMETVIYKTNEIKFMKSVFKNNKIGRY